MTHTQTLSMKQDALKKKKDTKNKNKFLVSETIIGKKGLSVTQKAEQKVKKENGRLKNKITG